MPDKPRSCTQCGGIAVVPNPDNGGQAMNCPRCNATGREPSGQAGNPGLRN